MSTPPSPLRLLCSLVGGFGLLCLSACEGNPIPPCQHDEGIDAALEDLVLPVPSMDLPPVCRRVFVVDGGGSQVPAAMLSSFDPETSRFEDLGILRCPSSSQPFSMAVARDNTAYVLYASGELFHVDLDTLVCTATPFRPGTQGFSTFGMGFTSDVPGGDAETLFIASGPASVGATPGLLGTIDLVSFLPRPLGTLAQMASPELTGTGLAELWGFTPNIAVPTVAQIDKRNAAFGTTFRLPSLRSTGSRPSAWAFAFWGGDFFMFLQRAADQDPDTQVHRLNRTTGELKTVLASTGRRIVGAGVSSCAPVVGGDR